MKHRLYIIAILIMSFCLPTVSSVALANDAGNIKACMLERMPVINDYKTQGIVGENNKGFVQVMGIAGEWSDVVAAENKDRQKVYQAIAAKTGAPVETVGARRAIQIRQCAAPGTWLQGDDGKWARK